MNSNLVTFSLIADSNVEPLAAADAVSAEPAVAALPPYSVAVSPRSLLILRCMYSHTLVILFLQNGPNAADGLPVPCTHSDVSPICSFIVKMLANML